MTKFEAVQLSFVEGFLNSNITLIELKLEYELTLNRAITILLTMLISLAVYNVLPK